MIFIGEEKIKSLLNWDDALKATEVAMKAESLKKSVKIQRVFGQIFDTPKWMLTMPGYLDDIQYGGWMCKILTGNPNNVSLPTLNANIVLMDQNTGALKAVISGVEITSWRTAAASAIATKYIHTPTSKLQRILAIFGCGEQGRAHAICFYNSFQFEEIRLWNRTPERATRLANELNELLKTANFKAVSTKEACARGADVIITTTSPGPEPLVHFEWLKEGVHINAVGVVGTSNKGKNYELDEETYKHAHVYVDNWAGANRELTELKQFGAHMKAEVGDLILGNAIPPSRSQLTVFQSLGMASEDCAMARMIFDLFMKNQTTS